ncbi:uncharacterized protein LOC115415986 [Sphaeramia orbicularis]|uniref:uncharacterized protein LOC115415986 n=1 Tax=Sphaeramia orbicularis TaxID=375764 RepID=UPI00117D4A0F|nr:uncharacterized protein LOC115415986 [Sphaeramia orbicularis]
MKCISLSPPDQAFFTFLNSTEVRGERGEEIKAEISGAWVAQEMIKQVGLTLETTIIHNHTPRLLHLLLLAELFVQSSSRPTHNVSMCGMLGSMIPQLDTLLNLSKKLHGLTDDELTFVAAAENKLDNLPNIQHTAAAFSSSKMNQTLSQLYEFAQSFQFHLNWLKIARDNVSLPCQPAEGASAQMLQLSDVLKASLLQISLDVPHTPLPSFPVVSTAFEALQFSVEISEHLQVFCHWAKRSIRHLQRQQRCPRQ